MRIPKENIKVKALKDMYTLHMFDILHYMCMKHLIIFQILDNGIPLSVQFLIVYFNCHV